MQMTPDPTVFVVDDDPAIRDSLRWLIESVGLPVETFNSARDFLDRYDPKRAGCLVLDVRMPGMSGVDLQEQLASRSLRIPIIIITGHADLPTAVRTLKKGALDFIEKPFSDQLQAHSSPGPIGNWGKLCLHQPSTALFTL